MMAADVDREGGAPDDAALASGLKTLAGANPKLNILVVDASIKTGRPLQATAEELVRAGAIAGIEIRSSACVVVDYPVAGKKTVQCGLCWHSWCSSFAVR
jgi:hypothetical protein